MESSQSAAQRQQRKRDIPDEFYEWVIHARALVDAHFPNETALAHNSLIIDTARSMMMMHKMGEIEMSVDDIRQILEDQSES